MGARSSRPGYQQWDLNGLARASGLQTDEAQEIYQKFMQAAGRDGELDMNEFLGFYQRLPGAQMQDQRSMQDQVGRVFRTFDRDGSGKLSFDEFLNCVVMMNRNMPRQDRLDYLIRQNNASGGQQGNGQISSQYGHQVFRRLNDYYGLPPGCDHQCWKEVDRNNRGYVTHDDFMGYIKQQQAYNQRYQ